MRGHVDLISRAQAASVARHRANRVDARLAIECLRCLVLWEVGDGHTLRVDCGVGHQTTIDGQAQVLNCPVPIVHHELTPGHVHAAELIVWCKHVGQQELCDQPRTGQWGASDGNTWLIDTVRVVGRQQSSMAMERTAPIGEGNVVAATIHQSVLVVGIALDVTRLRLVDVTILFVQRLRFGNANGGQNGGSVVLAYALPVLVGIENDKRVLGFSCFEVRSRRNLIFEFTCSYRIVFQGQNIFPCHLILSPHLNVLFLFPVHFHLTTRTLIVDNH